MAHNSIYLRKEDPVHALLLVVSPYIANFTSILTATTFKLCKPGASLGGGCPIEQGPGEGADRNGQVIVLAPEAGELDNWFGLAEDINAFGLFDLLSSCLSLSEDINSTGSILVAEERPVAIVAVGNAFSGGRAGV